MCTSATTRKLIAATLVAIFITGCGNGDPAPTASSKNGKESTSAPATTTSPATALGVAATQAAGPIDTAHAWLLHVPGIAGVTQLDQTLTDGIRDGGFKGEIEVYDWTGEQRGIAALVNRERNEREAQKIAKRILEHRRKRPNVPILLSGHSGGTGIVVFALEKLPKDVMVDGVLLLSPALSPTYDLSKALSHVHGRLYCFSSTLDMFVLGMGTKLFGTMDRQKGESAGRVGFLKPDNAADPAQYDKLVSCPYDKAWMRFGNIGDHMTVMSQAFAEHILAPLVLSHMPGSKGPLTRPVMPTGPIKLPATQPGEVRKPR
jgi:hypothetical protein